MTISSKDLSELPPPKQLRCLFQSLAVLDAIMCPEWEYRYYSHDCAWGPGETMGSMRNGEGDDLFALFNRHGCFMKGFNHEHWTEELQPEAFYERVPDAFSDAVVEPAFSLDYVTFCCWRTESDDTWHTPPVQPAKSGDADGSARLLVHLDGRPESYRLFARQYYEQEIPLTSISAVYGHERLTDEVVRSLNRDLSLADLDSDLATIGYPAAGMDH